MRSASAWSMRIAASPYAMGAASEKRRTNVHCTERQCTHGAGWSSGKRETRRAAESSTASAPGSAPAVSRHPKRLSQQSPMPETLVALPPDVLAAIAEDCRQEQLRRLNRALRERNT